MRRFTILAKKRNHLNKCDSEKERNWLGILIQSYKPGGHNKCYVRGSTNNFIYIFKKYSVFYWFILVLLLKIIMFIEGLRHCNAAW